jgi:hypothetical protein
MFCTQCGATFKEGQAFCSNCGTRRSGAAMFAPPRSTAPSNQPMHAPGATDPLAQGHYGSGMRWLVFAAPVAIILSALAGYLALHRSTRETLPDASLVGAPAPAPAFGPSSSRPTIAVAIIQQGATSLELPHGAMYLYGMATGGARASSAFAVGQYADVTDTAGQLAAALAYGTNAQDSYTTQTAAHVIGGATIAGKWDKFEAFWSSNPRPGAADASVRFSVKSPSLVVIVGLAASQQRVDLSGIPGLHIDAPDSGPSSGEGMIIAHADLGPGEYTVIEQSTALAMGQDAENMADLIGVFVFGFGRSP